MAIYQDDKLVKRAYTKVSYTKEQIDELKACMDPVTGPLYFMSNFMYVQHSTKGKQRFIPYPFQLDLIDSYTHYKKSINMVSRQMGKALCLETPIITPSGFKRLGDIKVNDTIYDKDGNHTRVTFITEVMNNRLCYEIEFMHGEKIIADAEHQWTYTDPHRGSVTTNTIELIERFNKFKNTTQSIHIRHCDTLHFDEKELPLDPYLFGLWLGDGSKGKSSITCTDADYTEYKNKLESSGFIISEFRRDPRSKICGNFTIYGIAKALKDTGAWRNKHIPHNYIFNSEKNRLELLRGLMDSDGTCEKTGVSRFYQSDKAFAESVRLLLSTLGIKSTITGRKTKFKENFSVVFATLKHDVFFLKRKLNRQHNLKDHYKNSRIYIRDIKEVGSVPVRCLQVDNADHLFLCGHTLIPTHNTAVAAGYLLWYSMFTDDAQILVTSYKYDSAQDIMDRVRYAYESIPDHIRAGVTTYNKRSIQFDNGSKITATTTTETTGRGMSLSLVYLDEFAFVDANIAKEFWTSLAPTLSTGGKCIITSTPNTDEDQFADIWFGANKLVDNNGNETLTGTNGFKPYMATWDAHPERDQVWADEQLASLGEDRFLREHRCCAQTTLITLLDLNNNTFEITIGDFFNKLKFQKLKTYLTAIDKYLGNNYL